MSLKTFGCRTLTALTFGALTLHGVSSEPPVPPVPVVFDMRAGGPGGSTKHKWQEEAHQKDLAIAAAKIMAEEKDEEAVVLAILAEAVKQFYT